MHIYIYLSTDTIHTKDRYISIYTRAHFQMRFMSVKTITCLLIYNTLEDKDIFESNATIIRGWQSTVSQYLILSSHGGSRNRMLHLFLSGHYAALRVSFESGAYLEACYLWSLWETKNKYHCFHSWCNFTPTFKNLVPWYMKQRPLVGS